MRGLGCEGTGRGAAQFALLGPLTVGTGRHLTASQQARLLGTLLLEVGNPVRAPELARWALGDGREDDLGQLHVLVARLRRQLRELRADAVVETTASGYLLSTAPDNVDVLTFEHLLADAGCVPMRQRRPLLKSALELWRGDVLAGLGMDEHPRSLYLHELRAGAVEELFALDVVEGDTRRLPELLAACRRHPLREHLRALAMLVLFRAGRQADALALYQEGRRELVDRLGVEPGPELRAAERAVLRHDVSALIDVIAGPPAPRPASPAERRPDHRIGAPARRPGHLPPASTSFVGRVEERERLLTTLPGGRLITLTGAGGVGKTRLAVEAARGVAAAFDDGVWWCDLASVPDAASLTGAVGEMLAATPQLGMTPVAAIVDSMKDRRALIVFDNCEHVLNTAADLVEALMAGCPNVTVLATSRQLLDLPGEQVWPIPPLDPESDALELFVQRSTAADRTFAVDGHAPVVVELCRRLDGLPLAVELAAARVRAMTPAEVLARLDDRFVVLARTAPRGEPRHRTLLSTIDWSYRLLSPAERALLDQLAVFPSSFTAEAVERICTDGELHGPRALECLTTLVDKSMVVAQRDQHGTRYSLLETIRHYAEAHARASGALDQLRDRHLAHFATVAEQAFEAWLTDYRSGQSVIVREWANFRVAAQHGTETRRADLGERLFAALCWPANYSLSYEVGDWARQASELPDAGPSTLGTAAIIDAMLGRFDDGERFARAGIDRAAGPRAPVTWMCWVAVYQGLSRAGLTEEAHRALVAARDAAGAAIGRWGDAFFASMSAFVGVRSAPVESAAWAERATRLASAVDNPLLSADVCSNLGRYRGLIGDANGGLALCRRGVEISDGLAIRRCRVNARNAMAQVAVMGDHPTAGAILRDAVEVASADRLWFDLWPSLRALARWWADHGRATAAAVVAGYLVSNGLSRRGQTVAALSCDPGLAAWLARGSGLDRDALIAFILDQLDRPFVDHHRGTVPLDAGKATPTGAGRPRPPGESSAAPRP